MRANHLLALCVSIFCCCLCFLTVFADAASMNISSLPTCPFSRWQGEPRYCYECRWCPFRSATCCEMEDEVDMLKSVNVSGTDDWDCFITIVHFQQCGRCSPSAKQYLQQVDLDAYVQNYVWDWRNLTIRPCKQACQYIYKQCNGAKLLNGQPVIPNGIDVSKFCDPFPAFSTDEMPCYNSGSSYTWHVVAAVALVMSNVLGAWHV
ncbi:GPI-anchored surface protein, putative [Bodo saltans]|uniref:GPI-anchored surface protein, putative n=1 Tax=Bodo saltans TaxID=75058 RepID=A0A0S4JW32_BODSA|nr:GPI-anchored surface protein, putative [Bodo saltans]|eukprot:CUG94449.1 GPI-anchored surface protein, putative [Bodo saltans]